ncbi:MAG: YfhO family protein [Lachnospiraceae bacterium]|nr:YfhO family protein [Lachnospiraceae bacterium]
MSSSRFRVAKQTQEHSKWGDRMPQHPGKIAMVLSFLIPVLVMLVIAIQKDLYPFGDKCFLRSDLYNQYLPFMVELQRKLKAGESLGYAWRLGLGTDFAGVYAYYLACPLNFLCVLVPTTHLIEFMTVLIFLKLGMCGLTMCYYLRKHFGQERLVSVCFAIMYALSGFTAAYNWDIMWLDVVYLFPLVILGLEEVMEGKGLFRYPIFLALTIYTNYYLAIMVCMFIVLYFVVLSINLPAERFWINLGKVAGLSVLSGALSAFVVLPGGMAILQTGFSGSTFPSSVKFYFNELGVIARHMMNVSVELKNDHWPNIYCGVAVFFLLPLYLMTKQIPLKKKIPMAFLVILFIESYRINVLNFIWHGFNYPDSLPARQAFIYIFVLLVMGYEAFLLIREQSRWKLISCYAIGAIIVLICMKFAKPAEDYENHAAALTLLFLTSYCILGVSYLSKNVGRMFLVALVIVFTTFEVGINTYQTSVSTVTRSKYLKTYTKNLEMAEAVSAIDDGVYRIDKNNRMTKNDGALSGFMTATIFSSTSNAGVVNFYTALGMDHSKVYYNFDGATPLTAAMLGVKYFVTDTTYDWSDAYHTNRTDVDVQSLYLMDERTSIGYALPESIANALSLEGENAFELQNAFGSALGASGNLFFRSNITADEETIAFTVNTPSTYYFSVLHASKTRGDTIKLIVTDRNGNEVRSKTYKNCRKSYLLNLGYLNEGDEVTLETTTGTFEEVDLNLYRLNEPAMNEALQTLLQNTLTVTDFSSNHLEGEITTAEGEELILAIPSDSGWSVWVDGEESEVKEFADAFIAIPLSAGDHHITLHYRPSGMIAGIVLSIAALAIFILLVYLCKCRKSRTEDEALRAC